MFRLIPCWKRLSLAFASRFAYSAQAGFFPDHSGDNDERIRDAEGGGTGLLFVGIALTLWSAIALFFLIVAWVAGGTAYKDSIYGNYAFIVLVITLVVGIASGLAYRHTK